MSPTRQSSGGINRTPQIPTIRREAKTAAAAEIVAAAERLLDRGRIARRRLGTEDASDELLLLEHRAKQFRAAIDMLPPKQLAAVLMHKYEGLEYAEIADILECSLPALKSLLFRAYETLRHRLAHFAPQRVA